MTACDVVTIADVRARRWCMSGAKEFCRRYDLDWQAFVRVGLPCEVMLATGDGMARQLVEDVRSRGNGNG